MAPRPDQLEHKVMALREQIEEARERAFAREQELAQLNDLRNEADGRLAIARRELAAFEECLAQEEARLEQVRVEAALAAFERAVSARDAAEENLARRIVEVLDGLALHEDLTNGVHELRKELKAHEIRADVPEQLPKWIDAWQRLQETVRASLGGELEEELIAAAAASPLRHAIDDLPTHLQEAARQRKRELVRARSRQK